MSRTYRNPADWQSVNQAYDRARQLRNRYAQIEIQCSRRIYWLHGIATKTDEELLAQAIWDYHKARRDGRAGCTESSRNRGFKRQCAQATRMGNRRYCKKVMMDPEYWYITSAPKSSDTDGYVWDWW